MNEKQYTKAQAPGVGPTLKKILIYICMIQNMKKDPYTIVPVALFIIFTIWWSILFSLGYKDGFHNLFFGAVYGTTMSLYGGLIGFLSIHYWGGAKSVMGRAMLFLSLGLLAQFFGQAVFSYYNIVLGVDIPYPSVADLGFFGSIPLYIVGILSLAKASGARLSLGSWLSQAQAVLIPLLMVFLSYILFLRHYQFAGTDFLTVFLDFGYPIGQGLFVSLAILTYSLTTKTLGGVMRGRVIFLVAAFIAQYAADFNFLYQNLTGTWYNGGYGDYLYLVAYTLMAMGLCQLRAIARELHAA